MKKVKALVIGAALVGILGAAHSAINSLCKIKHKPLSPPTAALPIKKEMTPSDHVSKYKRHLLHGKIYGGKGVYTRQGLVQGQGVENPYYGEIERTDDPLTQRIHKIEVDYWTRQVESQKLIHYINLIGQLVNSALQEDMNRKALKDYETALQGYEHVIKKLNEMKFDDLEAELEAIQEEMKKRGMTEELKKVREAKNLLEAGEAEKQELIEIINGEIRKVKGLIGRYLA